MSRPKSLILVGLNLKVTGTFDLKIDTEKFKKTLVESMDALNNVPNLYHQRFNVDPSAATDAPDSLDSLKKLVRDGPPHGGHWDAIQIGLGFRVLSETLPMFEDLVNTVATVSKGETKFLFTAGAKDHWSAVKRAMPDLEMGEEPKSSVATDLTLHVSVYST